MRLTDLITLLNDLQAQGVDPDTEIFLEEENGNTSPLELIEPYVTTADEDPSLAHVGPGVTILILQ